MNLIITLSAPHVFNTCVNHFFAFVNRCINNVCDAIDSYLIDQ